MISLESGVIRLHQLLKQNKQLCLKFDSTVEHTYIQHSERLILTPTYSGA